MPAAGQTTTEIIPAPPPPANLVDVQPRKMTLTVTDGTTVLAQDVPVPGTKDLILQKRRCTLVAKLDDKGQVRLDLIAAGKPD